MEELRTVLISLAGYEGDTVAGHVILVAVAADGERSSAEIRIELPQQPPQPEPLLWARQVLAAALAEL